MNSITFYPFPSSLKEPKMRKKCLDQILRPNDYNPRRSHRVCLLHFIEGHPTAVNPIPTLFPRNNYGKPKAERSTSSRPKQEVPIGDTNNEVAGSNNVNSALPVVHHETVVSTPLELLETCVPECELLDHNYSYLSKVDVETKDACCQTDLTSTDIEELEQAKNMIDNDTGLLRELFVQRVTLSDKSVQQYTGVPSKHILNGLFDIVNKTAPKVKYWNGQATNEEVYYQQDPSKKKSGPTRKLTPYHEFILTLVRLRLALLTFCLSDNFGVSQSRVSQICTTWVNLLHCVFGPMLKWPSSQKTRKHLPRSFKTHFPKTTCIIDCTEFTLEKPKSPTAQSQTYSSYKHRNTCKALVSITPTGSLNFISNVWGGNTSDRYITKESGFLDNIKAGDEVMADSGFLIRDLLLERRATLNIPPFTKKCKWCKGKRLNVADVKKTRSIAHLRIHVERAIERLKRFRILAGAIPLTMKSVINQILKVCGFLCNLHKPLVTK